MARTFRRLLRSLDLDALERRLGRHGAARRAPSSRPRALPAIASRIRRLASLHYQGQTFDLTVPVPDGALGPAEVAAIEEAFGREHERTYGHRAGEDEPVELTEIRVIGTRHCRAAADAAGAEPRGAAPTRAAPAPAYFGPEVGWLDTPVLTRADLATPRQGPCIVEEYDATCVVPPGARASLDAHRQHPDRALIS